MSRLRNCIFAASLVAALAGAALAQDNAARDRERAAADPLRLSQMRGQAVITEDDEKVGTVDEVALDLANGKAAFFMVDLGSGAGERGRYVPVPFEAASIPGPRQNVKVKADKRRFENAPRFDPSGWATLGTNRDWIGKVFQHYGLEPRWITEGDKPLTFVKATDVIGKDIVGTERDAVGKIEDIVVDRNRGKLLFAVVAGNTGERLALVPWQALEVSDNGKALAMKIARDKFREAPRFERGSWPDLAKVTVVEPVYEFYSVKPDAVYGYAPPAGGGNNDADNDRNRDRDRDRDRDADRSRAGWGADDAYNKRFDAKTLETHGGKIVAIERFQPTAEASQGIVLRMETDAGRPLIVHLGPEWFVRNQTPQLRENDAVRVYGSRVDFDGKPVILAVEVLRGERMLRLRDEQGAPRWDAWRPGSGFGRGKAGGGGGNN